MSRSTTFLVVLSLLIACSSPSYAQKYKVTFGEVSKGKVRPDQFIVEDSSGNIYMSGLRKKTKMTLPLLFIHYYDASIQKFIKKYNSDLNFVEENPVTSSLDKRKKGSMFDGRVQISGLLFFAGITMKNVQLQTVNLWGKTYVIHAEQTKERIDVKALEMDPATGNTGFAHKLLSFRLKKGMNKTIDSISVKTSPDGSKAVIFTAITGSISGKKTGSFAATVVSSDMNVIWSKEYTLPKESKALSYKSMDIGNDGNIYLFSREQKNRRTAPMLTLYTLSPNKPAPVRKNIHFGSYVVSDAYMILNSDNMPTIVGFYKTDKKQRTFEGILQGTIGEDGKVLISHKREFTKSYHELIATEKEQKKLDKAERKGKDIDEDDDYAATDLIRTEDGGLLFVAEYYTVVQTSRSSTNGKGVTNTTIYYVHTYGDLIVTKLDKDGNFVFMKKIAKDNVYSDGGFSKIFDKDYNLQLLDGNYYFIFNDDPMALENKHMKRKFWRGDREDGTFIVKMTPEGTLEKDLIMDRKMREGYTFNPRRNMMPVSKNKLAFMMVKGIGLSKKTKMGTIAIN